MNREVVELVAKERLSRRRLISSTGRHQAYDVQYNQTNKRDAEQYVKKDAHGDETSSPRVILRRQIAGNQKDKSQ
jgi:hypothetical protein